MALTWTRPESTTLETWRSAAACRSIDPDLFFPIGTTGTALDHIACAKAVCSKCPVTAECLEFALETNQDAGVWGGTSEEERRQLRRARARARRATPQTA
jgi:WhiB family transcriptional regulator, redox-sensing transcriptional regulator